MRTILIAILAAVPLAFATTSLAAPPSGWTFEVDMEGAAPGAVPPYRLAWTNHDRDPVRVPVDLVARVEIAGHYSGPSQQLSVAQLSCSTTRLNPPPVKWQVLQPGEALQRIGTLADFFDRCDKRCEPGTYTLNVKSDLETTAPSQVPDTESPRIADVEPLELSWHETIEGAPTMPTIAVSAGPGLKVTLTRADRQAKTTTAKVRLTVVNGFKHPIYFPPKRALNIDWGGRETTGSAGSGWRSARGGQSFDPWGPSEGTLVAPGKTWTVVFDLDRLNKDADHAWVNLYLSPGGGFKTTAKAKTPFFFAGSFQGLETQIY